MNKFKKGDRVLDDYLGAGSVVRPIKSGLDSSMIIAYMVLFDKTPAACPNMGENPCMVLIGSLKAE